MEVCVRLIILYNSSKSKVCILVGFNFLFVFIVFKGNICLASCVL